MTTKHSDDRRRYLRTPTKLKVTYRQVNEFIQDYARNISRGGMFMETTTPLKTGVIFNLELEVPTLKDPLALKARVRWTVESDAVWDPEQIRPGMGLQFVYESDEDRRRVESTVEGLIRRQLGPRAYDQLMGKG